MLAEKMIAALRRGSVAFALLGVVLFAGACENSVFDDDGGGDPDADPPTITELTGPETITAGDTLRLSIAATGQRNIDSVSVRLTSGSVSRDTVINVPNARTIDETVLIPLPNLTGTQLVVSARAIDESGAESDPSELTIEIEDAESPLVQILRPSGPDVTAGDTAAVGTGATVRVEARVADASGITEVRFIGLALRGDPELGTDTAVIRFAERVVRFPRPGVDTLPTDTIIRRDLPQLGDSTETVVLIVRATDLFGNVTADTVPVIVGGPDVQIIRPTDGATHSISADLTIRVAIIDPGGIESATLNLSGVVNQTIQLPVSGLPTADTITHIVSGLPTTGALVISATARNSRGISAPTTPVTVTVVAQNVNDAVDPVVNYTISPLPRLTAPLPRVEMTDTIVITASADDPGGTGVTQIGIIVQALLDSGDQVAQLGFTQNYATPRTNPDTTVKIAVSDLYADISASLASSVALPDSIDLRVTVFALDAAGNVDTTTTPTGGFGERGYLLTVAGHTIGLPGRGIISDAVIDTQFGQERLFLSNFSQSRVDVLLLRDTSFVAGGILAGAQPWGLSIDLSTDTLIVANSGGTNLSKINLRGGALVEDATQRVHTPDAAIFEFIRELDENLKLRYSRALFGYSDRPQFVTQAISTALLYSTVPTAAAEDGTIRMAIKQPGWAAYEVYFLFSGGDPADETEADRFIALNADQVTLLSTADGDLIHIVDHVPGFPSLRIDVTGDEDTAFDLARAAGSDVVKCAGGFAADGIGLQDTTFVAASGDRRWVAFGEGGTDDAGRIIMFDGTTAQPLLTGCAANGQSTDVQIVDLVHNAAERVTGLGLNENGTLGVARGDFAAYYFDRTLRLEGSYEEDINPGGFGAALHPQLDTESAGSNAETLSFVGTAESSIRIIDTYHFYARGDVPIAHPIVGPLRTSLPLPGFDNVGLTCPGDPRCVVVKLYGVVQSAGAARPDGVVVIDVRERDID